MKITLKKTGLLGGLLCKIQINIDTKMKDHVI